MQLDAPAIHHPPHIMAGREAIGAEFASKLDQIDELHALIARRTRHRRTPVRIFVDEPVDHPFAEPAFVIEHVVCDPQPVRDLLGIVDILAGAAGAAAPHRLAVIVELQGHADHLGAGLRGERSRDGAVDAARHGNDDPGTARRTAKLKINPHQEV